MTTKTKKVNENIIINTKKYQLEFTKLDQFKNELELKFNNEIAAKIIESIKNEYERMINSYGYHAAMATSSGFSCTIKPSGYETIYIFIDSKYNENETIYSEKTFKPTKQFYSVNKIDLSYFNMYKDNKAPLVTINL